MGQKDKLFRELAAIITKHITEAKDGELDIIDCYYVMQKLNNRVLFLSVEQQVVTTMKDLIVNASITKGGKFKDLGDDKLFEDAIKV